MPASTVVVTFSPTEHASLIPYIAALHASCISHDKAIATFLPPVNQAKLLAWWKETIAEVAAGKRFIQILLDQEVPGSRPQGTQLMGIVMLGMPPSETGAHRGYVETLFVSPNYRRHGGARALMQSLETEAMAREKTLLMADAEAGSMAEAVLTKLGYTEVGRVPSFSRSPSGGFRDEVFFYKRLAGSIKREP
ncbi:acetyltransferase [Xylariaceae sp. FL0016]|nr:acetyltransferase [Xylariaceae sp. FL0016]